MLTKYIHWLSAITLGLALTLMLYFSYLLLWPFKVLDLKSDCFQTIKSVYYAGEPLTYRLHYVKYNSLSASVYQAFVDGTVFQLPDRTTDNPMGEQNFISTSVTIPDTLPSGKYHLNSTMKYKVNAFREISYSARSNDFEIINLKKEL